MCSQFVLEVAGLPESWLFNALGYYTLSLFQYEEAARYFNAAGNLDEVRCVITFDAIILAPVTVLCGARSCTV